MDRIRDLITLVRSQLWLVPGLVMLGAAGPGWWLLTHGKTISFDDASSVWWLNSGMPATARELWASLLGGLMTMISLVVSITFAILTLDASQLGPFMIAIFLCDLQIQGVLA
jgi:uncharacterized membrane protein